MPTIVRFAENPIITPASLGAAGHANINGPSLIRAPSWAPSPLGRYYLYFADHGGQYIRLSHADDLHGPWKVHPPGTLRLEQVPGCVAHIASPDVVVDEAARQIRMYFHSVRPASPAAEGKPAQLQQRSFVALSEDGLGFGADAVVLADFYLRVWPWRGGWYGMTWGGRLCRSADGLSPFEAGPNPLTGTPGEPDLKNYAGPRHVAVDLRDEDLWVYWSSIGDEPEHILRGRVALKGDWSTWRVRDVESVLRPERNYEGARLPPRRSAPGAVASPEHALRDPAIFREGGRTYLLYSVAGESGIALAEVVEPA